VQARGLPLPIYAVESITGEAHNQVFEVSCSVESLALRALGVGPSRRRAEQAAATDVLAALPVRRSKSDVSSEPTSSSSSQS
jgi:ribonuclease III